MGMQILSQCNSTSNPKFCIKVSDKEVNVKGIKEEIMR